METMRNLNGLKYTKNMKKLTFSILILFFCSTFNSFGQGVGSVSGIVVENEFGEGLFGANIFINGTTRGCCN